MLALLAEIRTRAFAPLPPPGARVAAVVRCARSVEQGAPIAADLKLTVAPFDGSAEVVAWWTAVAARLEAVGLPLEGEGAETWGARLKIGKKGGGEHFDEAQRRDADAAYGRVGALYEYASLSSQLREKAEQLSRIAAALEVQKEMSRLKRLERFATLQSQAIALATRVTEGRVAAERSFTAAGLPATLGESVAAVWAALPALLRDALALAADDYDSWRARRPRQEAIQDDALPALLRCRPRGWARAQPPPPRLTRPTSMRYGCWMRGSRAGRGGGPRRWPRSER